MNELLFTQTGMKWPLDETNANALSGILSLYYTYVLHTFSLISVLVVSTEQRGCLLPASMAWIQQRTR